jgi:hypothetical protein
LGVDQVAKAVLNHYNYEWVECYVFQYPTPGTILLYRLYSPRTGHHFYTTDADERTILISTLSYNDEEIAAYVYPA